MAEFCWSSAIERMNSSVLLNVPDSISLAILSEWLSLLDVGRTDSAFCTREGRPSFLSILSTFCGTFQSRIFMTRDEYPVIIWSVKRGAKMNGFGITSKLVANQELLDNFLATSGAFIEWVLFDHLKSGEMTSCILEKVAGCCPNTAALTFSSSHASAAVCNKFYQQLTKAFQGLKCLSMFSSAISTAGLKRMLVNCKVLRVLSLSDVTALLPVEVAIPTLECLDAPSQIVSEEVLFAIAADCPLVKQLNIFKGEEGSTVSDAAVQALLQGCPLLEETNVEFATGLNRELRIELVRRRKLYSLILDDEAWEDMDDALLQAVFRVSPGLRVLKVDGRAWLSDASLAVCGQHCKNLESVGLHHCTSVTLAGLRAIAPPGNKLQKVDLWDNWVLTDVAVLVIAQRCPHLKEMFCPDTISSEAIVALAILRPTLEVVYVDSSEADDATLAILAQYCPRLRHVSVIGCPYVTREGMEALRKQYPQLILVPNFSA